MTENASELDVKSEQRGIIYRLNERLYKEREKQTENIHREQTEGKEREYSEKRTVKDG